MRLPTKFFFFTIITISLSYFFIDKTNHWVYLDKDENGKEIKSSISINSTFVIAQFKEPVIDYTGQITYKEQNHVYIVSEIIPHFKDKDLFLYILKEGSAYFLLTYFQRGKDTLWINQQALVYASSTNYNELTDGLHKTIEFTYKKDSVKCTFADAIMQRSYLSGHYLKE